MCDFIIDGDGLTLEELRQSMSHILEGANIENVNISGKEKFGLTEDETLYLISYTGHGAKWINLALRNDNWEQDKDKSNFVKMIDSALQKIPSVNNTTIFHATNSILPYSINTIFPVKSYLSTSIDILDGYSFIWKISTKKENSNARDISSITGNVREKEILFVRKTEFIIVNIEKKNNVTYCLLVEQ